ncbi:MAG: TIGR04551 family protein [Myxococcota bacterium]
MLGAALGLSLALAPAPSDDTQGLGNYGDALGQRRAKVWELSGYARTRGELQHNYDLDHGPTPSGQLLYPLPLGNPRRQLLTRADMRLRTDASVFAPRGWAQFTVRFDVLDNVSLGSNPVGIPSATTSQGSGVNAVRVKRAYTQLLTPLGVLAVGRMGNHWGLGMLANSGDCSGCDSSDASDRIAFALPAVGHVFAVAYDFSATGPFVPDRTQTRVIDVAPLAAVHSVTAAILRSRSPNSLARRRRGGRLTFEYGAYGSYRWQRADVPSTYLPLASEQPALDRGQLMIRDYQAAATDAWMRLSGTWFRVEAEAAYLWARVGQPSLIPGVELPRPASSNQGGFALESDVGRVDGRWSAGVDLGFASGDRAPGFGAYPPISGEVPQPGDLEGAQANPPYDNAVNNFRFHPDYRIDRILFREIIGTVTDATYVRPHVDYVAWAGATGRLDLRLAGVFSAAVEPTSTPGQARPLGVEIDPSIVYRTAFNLEAAFEPAVLLPLAGLDNRAAGVSAKPAQLYRVRLQFNF